MSDVSPSSLVKKKVACGFDHMLPLLLAAMTNSRVTVSPAIALMVRGDTRLR